MFLKIKQTKKTPPTRVFDLANFAAVMLGLKQRSLSSCMPRIGPLKNLGEREKARQQ